MVITTFFDGLATTPRLDHPEGIAVHPDGSVWCGGEAGQVYRIADGRIEQVATTGGFCLGLTFGPDGGLYVCDLVHRGVMRVDIATGTVRMLADRIAGRPFRANPNVAVVDGRGRLLVSDNGTPGRGDAQIVAVELDGTAAMWHAGPFEFANGMAFSCDGGELYVAETWARRIVAVQIRPDGSAGAVRVVCDLPGALPDGLAVDADGRLFVACYQPSQVLVVDPSDGRVQVVAEDPDAHMLCHPTNLAFLDGRLLAANLGRWHIAEIGLDDLAR